MRKYLEVFEKCNLNVTFRDDQPDLWSSTYELLPFRPVDYLASSLDYQLAYQRSQGGDWKELSCVLYSNGKPVGIWPLTVSKHNSALEISSQGRPIMPPLFIETCSSLITKKLIVNCMDVINSLASEFNLEGWTSSLGFIEQIGCSDWELLSMRQGARCSVQHELYVDLRLSLPEIKSGFRKSYRSLIQSGQTECSVDILSTPGNNFVWDEFRALHAEVSGRITRSLESWQQQHKALECDEAFLIFLRNFDGRMIGAGYFMHSPDEGVYAVGVYDRSLFHKPLGHMVQYRAIEELKRRGCRWYRIGRRSFPGNSDSPSDKDLSIAHFKEGFASNVLRSFFLSHHLT